MTQNHDVDYGKNYMLCHLKLKKLKKIKNKKDTSHTKIKLHICKQLNTIKKIKKKDALYKQFTLSPTRNPVFV